MHKNISEKGQARDLLVRLTRREIDPQTALERLRLLLPEAEAANLVSSARRNILDAHV